MRQSPRVILASQSKARKQLLERIGIKFSVVPTYTRESSSLAYGLSGLVKKNALAKATAVAAGLKSGIVIGADTVVYAAATLIGKPKHLRDAQRILKLLSRGPHWVYSGVAVIDVDSGRVYSDWDKTKVYMRRLSESQIRGYCRRYRPFDKAGGFDIQGPGAMLIEHIEGCFYNVVGLPLGKLLVLLKKIVPNARWFTTDV